MGLEYALLEGLEYSGFQPWMQESFQSNRVDK